MFKAAVSSYHSDDNKMEEIDSKCPSLYFMSLHWRLS